MDEYPQEHNKVMTYEYKLTKHSIILSIIMYIYMYVLKKLKLQITIYNTIQVTMYIGLQDDYITNFKCQTLHIQRERVRE